MALCAVYEMACFLCPLVCCLGGVGCDVSVNVQLKFQQSFEFIIVPLIQFIVRVLDITVSPQRQVRTMPTAQKNVATPPRSSWVWCSRACCYATTGAGVVQKVFWCRSCSFSTAVDTPVVAPRCRSCKLSTFLLLRRGKVHTVRKTSIIHRCSFQLGF